MKTIFSLFCFIIVEALTLVARVLMKYIELTSVKQSKSIQKAQFKFIKFHQISSQINVISVS
jgi:hypothetical protein